MLLPPWRSTQLLSRRPKVSRDFLTPIRLAERYLTEGTLLIDTRYQIQSFKDHRIGFKCVALIKRWNTQHKHPCVPIQRSLIMILCNPKQTGWWRRCRSFATISQVGQVVFGGSWSAGPLVALRRKLASWPFRTLQNKTKHFSCNIFAGLRVPSLSFALVFRYTVTKKCNNGLQKI